MTGRSHKPVWTAVIAALLSVCVSGALSVSASAMTAGPGWELLAHTFPTNLPPGGGGRLWIHVFNVGAANSSGPVTVTDTLPPGLTATDAGEHETEVPDYIGHNAWHCTGTTVVTCTSDPNNMPTIRGGGGVPSGYVEKFGPNAGHSVGGAPVIDIAVQVDSKASGSGTNRVTIAGGGARTPASISDPIALSSTPASFGFANWDVWFSNADGTLDTQAGSHPYEATFSFDLPSVIKEGELATPGDEARNIEVRLPPGLVGDPNAVPQCSRQQFDQGASGCPASSQVGIFRPEVLFGLFPISVEKKIFNLVPPAGVPAEFGFNFEGIETFLDSSPRTGGDYGITTHANNTPQRGLLQAIVTLWGVPGDPSHNQWREGSGPPCTNECASGAPLKPLLTLPTSCGEPQPFTIRTNSWQHSHLEAEASMLSHDSNGAPVGYTGCEGLGFGPTITIAPDTSKADSPAGVTVEVKPTVGGLSNPEGFSTSDIKATTVVLPQGLVINPGQAAGLQACQSYQDAIGTEEAPSCPSASKIGTAQAATPLLKNKLEGNVYILPSNPPNLRLLVALSGEGVNVKLVGHVHLDETTGQLTSTFEGIPEFPVTDFKLSFSGGAQAALATPTACGVYTMSADFTPWSSPFVADLQTTSSFGIESGPGNSRCASPLPFSPQLIAGSTTDQAGGFTDFTMLLQAPDGQQRIEKLQFKIPQGLLGMISQVPLCQEPQASMGTCSSASQIGHTVVASGPGPYPLVVPQPGQPPAPIYLTGAYRGAPYGLSIVVPVVVGPFTLQTQIVRAKIEIDPVTAQITVTTDPLPQVIGGVPTDLRTVNAVIDRPGFMFNPTSCEPMSFSGTAFSAQGASTPISSHFQMGSCQSLKFKPDFRVSTAGKTSRKNGASLDVKLIYPTGPLGANQASSQSNIKSVKVDLPKQLPSRLTTLQKACTAATFEANPANCPVESRVGQVTAITPVLPVPLTGPAYFVSYGDAKFPELVFVLQGYGVTVDVHAETFISKAGITSSTLHRVPDVPISSFELKLPQGPYSALAANGNFCKSTLKMPTAFTAQNNAVIHQSTPINVTGCAKLKTAKKAKKPNAHHKKGK